MSLAKNQSNGSTNLLWRLPAELRLQIWDLCLPPRQHFLDVLTYQREICWLGSSRAIFEEAAPLLYGKTSLYFDLEPGPRTRRRNPFLAFQSHFNIHYDYEVILMEAFVRANHVKRIMLEIWSVHFDDLQDFLSWFITRPVAQYFRTFAGLVELCISLRNVWIGRQDETVLRLRDASEETWIAALLPEEGGGGKGSNTHLRKLCQMMRQIGDAVGPECRLRWSLPGEVFSEVSFLRVNVPEQRPSERERSISRFLDRLWQFVRSRDDEQLDMILGRPIVYSFQM